MGLKKLFMFDAVAEADLKARGLFIFNELIPDQSSEVIEAKLENYAGNGRTSLEVAFCQASLPEEWAKVQAALRGEKIGAVVDKRGSLLYLSGNKLLNHLINVCKLGQDENTFLIFGFRPFLMVSTVNSY